MGFGNKCAHSLWFQTKADECLMTYTIVGIWEDILLEKRNVLALAVFVQGASTPSFRSLASFTSVFTTSLVSNEQSLYFFVRCFSLQKCTKQNILCFCLFVQYCMYLPVLAPLINACIFYISCGLT